MRKQWPFLTAIVLLVGAAFLLQATSHGEEVPARMSLDAFPLVLDDWKGKELGMSDEVLDILRLDDYMMRGYTHPENPYTNLYVGFYKSQREGSTYHSPKNCLPGAGWDVMRSEILDVQVSGFPQMRINKVLIQKGLDQQLIFYWYQDRGRVIASEYWAKFYLIYDAMAKNRTDGSLVRVSVPIVTTEEAAVNHGVRFIQLIYPPLTNFLPS